MIRKLIFAAMLLLWPCMNGMAENRKVMVIAELGGQHVEFTQRGLGWLKQQARLMNLELTEVNDCRTLGKDSVAKFDLIIQLNYPPYMWSDEAVKDFERYIDEGQGGWIGFHHASLLGEFDGFPMWQWFSDWMGGIRFQNYIAEKADGTVNVEDVGHPVMAGVPQQFVIAEDEWYTYDRNPRQGVHVLASVDESSYQPASQIRMGDHPVIWTNNEKRTRNVYFQIGHSASLFDNPAFVRMFLNAIRWALGDPMEPDYSRSMEAGKAGQMPLQTLDVPTGKDGLQMAVPVETSRRAKGNDGDPDYALYGTCTERVDMHGANLNDYNRITMDVRSDIDAGIANLNLVIENATYAEVGAHLINMHGNDWQHVTYDIGELPREHVYGLRFYTDIKGRNLSQKDTIHYCVRNIRFERVDHPEKTIGWEPDDERMAYSTSGYLCDGVKTAIVSGRHQEGSFSLKDVVTGDVVFTSDATRQQTTTGDYLVLDFSPFSKEGLYQLQFGEMTTPPFVISADAMQNSCWRVLNYVNAQRCGAAVEGIHKACHRDVFARHDGKTVGYGGGWHDAGDLSQQTMQTADVAYSLLELASACQKRNPQLAHALTAEARHGIRQMLDTRFGDGYRASSIGLLHWTDGVVGTDDDIFSVRVQNNAFDNFLYAAYEAGASMMMDDRTLADAALTDYRFASEKLAKDGFDRFPHMMEHTYNASPSLQMAAASWASTQLFRLTGDEQYARKAVEYIGYVVDCQETAKTLGGYFYRDDTRRAIVHFIHQSREQLFMQALTALCETQPAHADYGKWHAAIGRYGGYLKQLQPYTAPYGMAPSGVYQEQEYADADGFDRLHLWAPANAHELYDQQLHEGAKVDDTRYVRRFPIWFSIFNGNEAILLSSGKAAALCGRFLHDEELMQIGREQLYWTLGKNPFSQSLIYGEGHRYPSMDSFSSGEIEGEIPVGIRSKGNADIPFWPQTNNACYKEVWLTSAGKWLSLVAELM